MATIVTRSGKGSPLTNNEVDANFTNLNTELGTKANTSSLATVATTGAYADLTGKPTIASADGSVVVTGTTNIDLSVAVAGSTSNVVLPIRNTTGATLAKGTAVYISGATGQISTVSKAIATGDATSAQTLGLVTANIANNSNGNVTLIGTITNIDTSAYTDGQQLYLSPTTAGTLTATKPYAPQHLVYVAVVEHAHPSQGKLFVKVQNGYEMDELHNVSAQSPANNDGLFYNTSTSLWEKKSIATALGYTPYNATNPSGYITSSALSPYALLSGAAFTGNVTTTGTVVGTNVTVNTGGVGFMGMYQGGASYTGYLGFFNAAGTRQAYVGFAPSGGGLFAFAAEGSTGFEFNKVVYANGGVTAAVDVRAPIFYDSNNTAYYVDPNGTSNIGGLTVANTITGSVSGNAATATNISNTGTVTLASATESNSIYATAPSYTADQPTKLLNFDWYGNVFSLGNIRSGSTPSSGFGVYYTPSGGSRAEFMRIDTSGSVLINRTSASGIGKLNVEGGVDVTSGNVTVQAGYGIAWRGDQSRIMTPDDNSYGALIRWGATGGCRLFESTTERLRIDGTGSVTAFVDVRAPIFYDSNNTNRYLDPSSTSVLTTVEAYGSGFRSLVNGSASISSQLYFANAANTRAWNWQLDENDAAALWSYGGSSWGKRLGLTHNSELFLRNSSGSDVSLAYPSTFGYSSSYKTMVLGNQSLTTVCIGVSPASNPSGSFNGGGLGLEVMFRNGVNFITPNSANNGYHFPLSLADGYTASSGSFRAPIFYDSNDTGYYIDPNTSGTSAVFAGDIHINDTTWGADKALRFREGASDTYGGFIKYTAGDSLELGTRNNSTTDTRAIYISRGANWAGSDGSFRAPIFYDSENTAYYVDPNGGSRTGGITADSLQSLGNLTVNSGLVYRSDWTTRFQSGSDFTSGTLVTTDIPATGFAGESFVIEITGKSYSATNLPFKVVAQGYLYNDTIINYTGISYGGDFATYIKVFEEGGVLKFWWPRISYWNSFNVNVMAMDGATNNTITRNRVTAIGNSTEPTGTKKQQINLIKTLKTGDAAGSISGFNNPTTAPTANTIVYRDAAGDISAREIVLSSGLSAQTPTVLVSMYPTTNQLVRTTPAAVAAAIQGAASGSWGINVTGTAAKATDLAYPRYTNNDFNTLGGAAPNGFRAYTNYIPSGGSYNQPPNGAGDYKVLQFGDLSEGSSLGNWGGQIVMNFYDDRMWFRRSSSTTWQSWREFIHDGNYTSYAMPSGASATNSVDVRAPIFYDSNDTSRYIDPNSGGVALRTSGYWLADTTAWAGDINGKIQYHDNSWYISAANQWVFRASSGAEPFRVTQGGIAIAALDMRAPLFYDNNDTAYFIDPNSTSRLSVANVNFITLLNDEGLNVKGIRGQFAAGSDGQGISMFSNVDIGYPSGWGSGLGNTPSRGLSVYGGLRVAYSGGGFITSDTSVRSPVFYDSDNTAFYTSPNTTSNVSEMVSYSYRGNGNVGGTGSASWHPSGIYSAGYNWLYGGISAGGGDITAVNEVYANRYYDSGNTAFYVDPASTSNLSGLTVSSRISGSISGDAQRLFNHTGANNDGLQYWNTVGNDTLNPNTGWHYAIRMGHGDADTYYSATIAVDFFNDNVWLRRKGGGANQPWKRFALYENPYALPFYANVYYDADNSAYYLDASSTGTSLNVAGSIIAAGNVTAYSDIRIKANVETIPSALDKLDLIRGVTYTRTDLDDKEQRYAGVIAQEIEAVLPEAVRDLGDIKAVDYNATIALLIQAVKELRDEVEMLRK
jgi:hypothetical protein